MTSLKVRNPAPMLAFERKRASTIGRIEPEPILTFAGRTKAPIKLSLSSVPMTAMDLMQALFAVPINWSLPSLNSVSTGERPAPMTVFTTAPPTVMPPILPAVKESPFVAMPPRARSAPRFAPARSRESLRFLAMMTFPNEAAVKVDPVTFPPAVLFATTVMLPTFPSAKRSPVKSPPVTVAPAMAIVLPSAAAVAVEAMVVERLPPVTLRAPNEVAVQAPLASPPAVIAPTAPESASVASILPDEVSEASPEPVIVEPRIAPPLVFTAFTERGPRTPCPVMSPVRLPPLTASEASAGVLPKAAVVAVETRFALKSPAAVICPKLAAVHVAASTRPKLPASAPAVLISEPALTEPTEKASSDVAGPPTETSAPLAMLLSVIALTESPAVRPVPVRLTAGARIPPSGEGRLRLPRLTAPSPIANFVTLIERTLFDVVPRKFSAASDPNRSPSGSFCTA